MHPLPPGRSLPDALPPLLPVSPCTDAPSLFSESQVVDACNVSDSPGDTENLRLIVAFLKYLEYCLHYDEGFAAPADREVILYSLILRHVSVSCYLFIQEQTTLREGKPRVRGHDGGHAAFKIDESLFSFCEEACDKLHSVWRLCSMYDLVKDWKLSILKNLSREPNATYAPAIDQHRPQERMCIQPDDAQIVSEISADQGRPLNEKAREEILAAILRELDNSWRRRSYAAPSISEIGQYREIRKLVISCLGCIGGKHRWRECFGDPRTKPTSPYSEDFVEGTYGIMTQYYLVVARDLMHEFTDLMRECRHHHFDILALKEAANPEPKPLLPDMAFVRVRNMEVDNCNDYAYMESKTRLAHLQDILKEMQNINERPLTVADRRFYMLAREHVESAIWHGENEPVDYEHRIRNSVVSEQARAVDVTRNIELEYMTFFSHIHAIDAVSACWYRNSTLKYQLKNESQTVKELLIDNGNHKRTRLVLVCILWYVAIVVLRFCSLNKSWSNSEDSSSGKTQGPVCRIISSLEYIKSRWFATPPTLEEHTCYFQIRNILYDKRCLSFQMSDFGVAPLRKEETEDVIRRFLDETLRFFAFARRELQLDEESLTYCKKNLVRMPVDVSSGLQHAMKRIDRAAVMMFKRNVVVNRMLADMEDILSTLWHDLDAQRVDDLSDQAAIFESSPFAGTSWG